MSCPYRNDCPAYNSKINYDNLINGFREICNTIDVKKESHFCPTYDTLKILDEMLSILNTKVKHTIKEIKSNKLENKLGSQ